MCNLCNINGNIYAKQLVLKQIIESKGNRCCLASIPTAMRFIRNLGCVIVASFISYDVASLIYFIICARCNEHLQAIKIQRWI